MKPESIEYLNHQQYKIDKKLLLLEVELRTLNARCLKLSEQVQTIYNWQEWSRQSILSKKKRDKWKIGTTILAIVATLLLGKYEYHHFLTARDNLLNPPTLSQEK